MKPADEREEVLFREALQRAKGPEREAFLNQGCAENEVLRKRLAALLRANESPDPFLEPQVGDLLGQMTTQPAPDSTVEEAGARIGRYKLLEKIGEGGCGVVYMAEQEEPIRRRVAFKVIKLGMDTKQVIARFESERQALALVDHPNIAKVLDAGATASGRPYFVMELVRGLKITDFCDQNNLSTEERLNLFAPICHAIQHAHQKGIIHRDIKPSNILVISHDGVPVPKVIDFGIAKATGGQVLSDKTICTAFGQFVGTPAYMSPEQAELTGLDVDTRSDVYALGVLLYELLTGRTPFDQKELAAAGLDEMRRILREKEPVRPSTRLSTLEDAERTTVARRRHSEPPQLIHLLRGDLDWIVMKCLEKDRTRRYETANSLAQDILNHIGNEPVTARPPSRGYRLQKLVRRNKLAFAAAGAVTAALLIGLGLSTWLFLKEQHARRRAVAAERTQSQLRQQAEASAKTAQAEGRKSEQIARFLKDMLKGVGPSVAKGRNTAMLKEILDKTAERVGTDLKESPEVEAELRATVGDVYRALEQLRRAEEMYRAALGLNRRLWGNLSTNVADSLDKLADVLTWQDKPREAEPLLRELLTIRTNLLGAEHPKIAVALRELGDARMEADAYDEAEVLYRQSLAMERKLGRNDSQDVVSCLGHLSRLFVSQRKPQEAEAAAREGLAIKARLVGGENPDKELGLAQAMLGQTFYYVGKPEEAESILRSGIAMLRRVLGPDNSLVAQASVVLAYALEPQGKLDEAEQVEREALAALRNPPVANPRPSLVAVCLGGLGRILTKQGKFAEAEAMLREQIAALEDRQVGQVDAIGARYRLLAVLRDEGKLDQAEAVYREAMATQEKLLASRTEPDRYATILDLIDFHDQFKPADAESLYREALRINRQSYTNRFDQRSWLAGDLGEMLGKEGRPAEAEPLLREAITNAVKQWPHDFASWRWQVYNLIDFLHSQGKQAEACRVIGELLKPELLGQSRDAALLEVRANLSGRGGKWKDAAADYGKLIEMAPTDHWLCHQVAPVLVISGDLEAYRQLCRRIVARAGSTKSAAVSHQMALDCLLLPPSRPDLPTLGQLAEFGVTAATVNQYLPWNQLTKGLAEYRQGHFAEAAQWAQRTLLAAGKIPERDAQAYAVLAMAQRQLKHADDARAALGKAVELTQTKLPRLDGGDLGRLWHDLVVAHLLLREAKLLIDGETAAGATLSATHPVCLPSG